MTENKQLAMVVANILPNLTLQDLEEGCESFIKDWEEDNSDPDVEFLYTFLLDRKLKYYEEEY